MRSLNTGFKVVEEQARLDLVKLTHDESRNNNKTALSLLINAYEIDINTGEVS